ncbi:large conductance mechanosensitive channel [Microbacterium endophyticum]|uniref:Large-conductance mechanosensitive channel n=1 Tax=Microbacterium endophyticum TaxID=1526412 RepID=A0A7W4YMS2_9MICO|nr:large conductance mechanosensitive channel protein MscL [Microbacterium endophyticum]MBB2974966.1 large conductance mechanosensitive channel [Microbacterium endophyticum]NIK37263.1 large conductance mechanosensitive channel [Microbacterium endophyticum]
MIKGFKEFILRGNVIDLAVAVVIGAAFTAIVTALVTGFINPLIGVIFQVGSLDKWTWDVPVLIGDGVSTFAIGSMVGAVINFLAVAVVVYFAFVFPMNRIKARAATKAGVNEEPESEPLPTEQELLMQIRDLLQKQEPTAKQ